MHQNLFSSSTTLKAIAEAASSLYERLEDSYELAPSSAAGEDALARWRKLAAQEDDERFHDRLAHAGWEPSTLTRALSGPPRLLAEALPAWTETLARVLQMAEASMPDSLDLPAPMPFQEILGFFVLAGREALAARMGERLNLLSRDARQAFEAHLMTILVETAGPTLLEAFKLFRHFRTMGLFFPGLNRGSTTHYAAFIQQHRASGLQKLFGDSPVLARLLAIAVDDWVDAVSEFLLRFEADRQALSSLFARHDFGRIRRIELGLSDRHQAGRSVIKLTFDEGLTLVYKPRDLSLEAAYNDLLAWLNRRTATANLEELRVLRVLDRGSHGWMEAAHPAPCENEADVRRYYRRAGMLLALVYLLNGTDLHRENLIASGPDPVLVDLEMLFASQPRGLDPASGATALIQALHASVLISGLLPFHPLQNKGEELSALTGRFFADEILVREWSEVNTDEMDFAPVARPPEATPPNLPRRGEAVRLPHEEEESLVSGFEEMYRWLIGHARDLPLEAFKGCQSRHMVRNTQDYMLILMKAREPAFLKDGAARSLQIDRLASRLLIDRKGDPEAIRQLLRQEHLALERLDVPRFVTRTDSDALYLDETERIPGYFTESGWEIVQRRRASLSGADLATQVRLIRGAIWTSAATGQDDFAASWTEPDMRSSPASSREDFLAEALRIGETLAEHAVRARDRATWMHAGFDPARERLVYRQADLDLYNGVSGIGLFLIALGCRTEEARFSELGLAALRGPLEWLKDSSGPVSLGGVTGIGSQLYAFTRAGALLGSEELLAGARTVSQRITAENLARDTVYDLMGGAAGSILALLSYRRLSGDEAALDRAVRCGHHLLENRRAVGGGLRSWIGVSERALCGFSHGAAGIAYALMALHDATGETAFREAAEEAIAYERRCFDAEAGNWPDLRVAPSEDPAFMCSWCHGAPGIALGRLGLGPRHRSPEVLAEIDAAVAATLASPPHGFDHLCCGNFGRVDIVLEAARRLERPEWRDLARQQASWAIRRARQAGSYFYSDRLPPKIPYFGLFSGVSGIGYALLRLADPDALPSILMLD